MSLRKATGLTGLKPQKYPRETLKALYEKILNACERMPKEAAYRRNTEAIANSRLTLINSEKNLDVLEQKINDGMIEEVILQARKELQLSRNMLEWKPWEPLIGKAPKNQWKWPIN